MSIASDLIRGHTDTIILARLKAGDSYGYNINKDIMEKILVVAARLDGYIAQSREQISTAWTSSADRKWFRQLSQEIGTLIMGKTTFETLSQPLAKRKTIVLAPKGGVVGMPLDRFTMGSKTLVYQSEGRPLTEVLWFLEDRGVKKVAICGGASVYQSFLQAGLVDELYVTIEPVLLGGGIRLTEGVSWEQPVSLELIKRLDLDDQTTVFNLRVKKTAAKSR